MDENNPERKREGLFITGILLAGKYYVLTDLLEKVMSH